MESDHAMEADKYRQIDDLIAARWDEQSAPPHGFYCPKDHAEEFSLTCNLPDGETKKYKAEFVLYPYGEVLRRFLHFHAGTPRARHTESVGTFAAREHFELLVRSIQRVGQSKSAVERTLESRDIHFDQHRDFKLDIDSVLFHARIMADILAMTIPSLFTGFPNYSKRHRLRKIIKQNTSETSRYYQRFTGCDMGWFVRLAGDEEMGVEGNNAAFGLRDVRMHHGAIQWVFGTQTTSEGISTPWSASVALGGEKQYSQDLIRDLRLICSGLLGFLDHLSREAGQLDERLDLRDGAICPAGLVPVFGETGFLKSVLPLVGFPADAAGAPGDHSSPA